MSILILETLFESLNCEIDKAYNGFEATQKATSNQYDLVMMDLEMPICNGYQACLNIKQKSNQYVVAVTSNQLDSSLVTKLMQFQFDDWF